MESIVRLPADEMRVRHSLPPGAHWRVLHADDGWPIRMVEWPADAGAPTILFLNGRADFIEKYSEAYWEWRAQGYGVTTLDWRGQGLSGRFGADARGYFDRWLGDLASIIDAAAVSSAQPLVLAAHSMGGHLALRRLAANPGDARIARAILFAPMVGIGASGLPASWLAALARTMAALGRGDSFPPGQLPQGSHNRSPQRQRVLTSDIERFADEGWWIDGNPQLASAGANWGWIAAAVASCAALAAPGVAESIAVPVDVFIGSREHLIDVAAARALVARVRLGCWHEIGGAAHELLRETGDVQKLLHARISAIINGAA